MKITSETTSEEVKKATKKNISQIPIMAITYTEGKTLLNGDVSAKKYWLNKVCKSVND